MKLTCKIFLAFFLVLSVLAQDEKKESGDLFKGDLSKAPTNIKSEKLTFNAKDRTFVYTGKVEVTQKDLLLTADILEGKYTDKNQIENLIARSNVVITQGPELRATAQRAFYDAIKETITLTENPQLEQKGSALSADKIIIYVKENRSEALGAVQVKLEQQEGSKLKVP